MNKRLQVMKFGGTSVGDAACIARAAKIVVDAAREYRCVAVVSAMSGITNRLIEAANHARGGNAAEATAIRSEEQRLNSSHSQTSYAVFCLKKKKRPNRLWTSH